MKNEKEIELIEKAIMQYSKTHAGKIMCNLSLYSFDDNGEVIDGRYWLRGFKDTLLIDNAEMKKIISKSKKDFISL